MNSLIIALIIITCNNNDCNNHKIPISYQLLGLAISKDLIFNFLQKDIKSFSYH